MQHYHDTSEHLVKLDFIDEGDYWTRRKKIARGADAEILLPAGTAFYFKTAHNPHFPELTDWKTLRETFSEHYVKIASIRRAPIFFYLPNEMLWTPDAKQEDGKSWLVLGDDPEITVWPNIQTHGYTGWVRDGWLSIDLLHRSLHGVPVRYMN